MLVQRGLWSQTNPGQFAEEKQRTGLSPNCRLVMSVMPRYWGISGDTGPLSAEWHGLVTAKASRVSLAGLLQKVPSEIVGFRRCWPHGDQVSCRILTQN